MPIDPSILVQLEAAVEQCGVPLSEVEISYEDYLQSEEIRVSSGKLSDKQIICLQKTAVSPPYPIVTFENREVSTRDRELQRIEGQKEARAWFEKNAEGLQACPGSIRPKKSLWSLRAGLKGSAVTRRAQCSNRTSSSVQSL